MTGLMNSMITLTGRSKGCRRKTLVSLLILSSFLLNGCNLMINPTNRQKTYQFELQNPLFGTNLIQKEERFTIRLLGYSFEEFEISKKPFIKYPRTYRFKVQIANTASTGEQIINIPSVFVCISNRNVALPFHFFEIKEQNDRITRLINSKWIFLYGDTPINLDIVFIANDFKEMIKTKYYDFCFVNPLSNKTIKLCRIDRAFFYE
jgi:hypothetical protein